MSDYELTFNCVVTLPRFNGFSEAARPGIEAFMERIRYREHRHCEIFTEYANKFKAYIDSGPTAGCNSLVNVIRTKFNALHNECGDVQKKYDKETLHGRTEGADLEWHLASEADRLLMAEGMTAPAVKVVPEITYEYYDVRVKEEGVGGWRTATGGIECWNMRLNWSSKSLCRALKATGWTFWKKPNS